MLVWLQWNLLKERRPMWNRCYAIPYRKHNPRIEFETVKRPLGNLVVRLLSLDNPHKVVDVKSVHMTQSTLRGEIFNLPPCYALAFLTIFYIYILTMHATFSLYE